ncbi:phosphonoacetate hydrolase [Thermanaeromonas toyohensis ToBE]|uniref:Phosphonoacetate hydrolase n=1 Tax=Thermanaeromonas toyohensis ToBE TaxID=698762 RepID=A0A1W1VK29_9FIRM|nr:alkaline phosphatase family protein [Thermanaeromonas toyohensis]SMB93722.1 phosphonoacetate hydrolase [Thermanaeromonas toyohensis ToBE]
MLPKILIFCLDGCAPAYLQQGVTPNLEAVGRQGFYRLVQAAAPTVTNVNHATILTGSFPDKHGVTGNFWYDPQSEARGFVEDPGFVQEETIIDLYARCGGRAAILTVKGKVVDIFGRGISLKLSVEKPDPSFFNWLGLKSPPPVASIEASIWLLEACYRLLKQDKGIDLIYCTTNDYPFHHFGPETAEGQRFIKEVDRWIGLILDLDPDREVYITADHGMNSKRHLVNMQKKLEAAGLDVVCVGVIKDRYKENHPYEEGGALYLYLRQSSQEETLIQYLKASPFIDSFYKRQEAALQFHLPPDRIGDWVLFAPPDVAFAEVEEEELIIPVRTHGSLYEREVPLFALNARRPAEEYIYTRDIVCYLKQDLTDK